MRKISIRYLLLFLLIAFIRCDLTYDYNRIAVKKVYDGDTIQLIDGEKVRFIGIDCPETRDNDKLYRDAKRSGEDINSIMVKGRQAYVFTRELLKGKHVRLEFDEEKRDQYGRLLAYVWVEIAPDSHIKEFVLPDDYVTDIKESESGYEGTYVFVNATILKAGFAKPLFFPPNDKYKGHFQRLYQEAKEAKRGFWQ